ncbi:MAG: AraC family transcriptional regulator [Prevotella sp.]|jgi:AraC-like DNA-binding protein|nr:AraC family transcriptional regulator [Prevotella sp.]
MIIPTHKITDHAESGISIRRLTPDILMPADRPFHHRYLCRSTSEYIQRAIVLRMKRELAYSTQSIQEISRQLGFEDYTYFSRLFSKTTGVSPSTFREKYHD